MELHPLALDPILSIPGWDKQEWLFGAGPTSANSFRRDLKAACKRASVDWYHPHAFGRHFSVTRMLRKGYSVAHVADAHGMPREMVTRRYGHLSKRESTAALHETGDDLFNAVLLGETRGKRLKRKALASAARELKMLEASSTQDMPDTLPSEGSTLSS